MSYEKVRQVQSRIIIGTKQTLKAMRNGHVSEVFIAADADKQITEKVACLAQELQIPCERVESMKELGSACGIEVGAAAAAVKKTHN